MMFRYVWYVKFNGKEIKFEDRQKFNKFVLENGIVNDNTLCRNLNNEKGSEISFIKFWGECWRNVFNDIEFFDTRRLATPDIRIEFVPD